MRLADQSRVSPALLRVADARPARLWNDNTMRRDEREHLDCALSFGIAGDLSFKGYKGLRLFGTSHTLSAPAAKGAQ